MSNKLEDAPCSKNSKLLWTSVEALKREEWNRRRLLRLEQVRQQSKDIALLVRQKVKREREKQNGVVSQRVTARTQQWQARKLRALQSEYHSTLKNIGSGHAEAAQQPNLEAESKREAARLLLAAQKRGEEALLRLREEESGRRKADEARRVQQQHVRAVEEARSAAVVSLPLPESTVTKSVQAKKSVSISKHAVNTKCVAKKSATQSAEHPQCEQAWPIKHWSQSTLPLGIVESQDEISREEASNILSEEDCHSKGANNVRGFSNVNSFQPTGTKVEEQAFAPSSSRVSRNASGPSSARTSAATGTNNDVKLYDHMNRYQHQYDKHHGVAERVEVLGGELNAHEVAEEVTAAEVAPQSSVNHDLQKREQERSRQALHRAYVQRDYKELLGSLAVLSKQRAALSSLTSATTAVVPEDKTRQKQMNTAVEELLPGEHHLEDDVECAVPLPDTPDGSLMISRLGDTPGTIPKLNVGRWAAACPVSDKGDQSVHISRTPSHRPVDITSSEESVKSIILAPAPQPVQQSADGKGQLRSERNSALRSLLQRINDEREQVLKQKYHGGDQEHHPHLQNLPGQESQQHRVQQEDALPQEAQQQEPLQEPHEEEQPQESHQKNPLTAELQSLHQQLLQQRKQLEEQRGEVCRLDASIGLPECKHSSSPLSEVGTRSSESMATEPSYHSDILETGSGSPNHEITPTQTYLRSPKQRDGVKKVKRHKTANSTAKWNRREGHAREANPTKRKNDSNVYSMDVSLSSVTMDHTTNSSSGSQSVSLHGVQVLVKVCGMNDSGDQSRHEVDFLCKSDQRIKPDSGDQKIKSPLSHNLGVNNTEQCFDSGQALHISDLAESRNGVLENHHKSKEKRGKPVSKASRERSRRLDQHTVRGKEGRVKSHTIKSKREQDTKRNIPSEALPKDLPSLRSELLHDAPTSASTSYLSPPDHILSSLSKDIQSLIAIARNNTQLHQNDDSTGRISQGQENNHIELNPLLARYINRLLAMSRESVDRLNVSCSEVSTPSSTIFGPTGADVGTSYSSDSKVDAEVVPERERSVSPVTVAGASAVPPERDVDLNQSRQSVDAGREQPEPQQQTPLEWLMHPATPDQGSLTELTKQCHDKISALTKMIAEVRRQAVLNSPGSNHSTSSSFSSRSVNSPRPLDSTAYMSPPPKVLEWVDLMLPPEQLEREGDRSLYDPYSVAIRQLLADVRSQMTSGQAATGDQVLNPQQEMDPQQTVPQGSDSGPPVQPDKQAKYSEPVSVRPKPPVAFWRNLDRCNISSPTEPHELSTIPELGVTLPDSTHSHSTASGSPESLSPISVSTPPDIMAELIRRKILTSPFSWAKKIDEDLKTQQPYHCSNSSNSTSLKSSNKESDLSTGNSRTGRSDMSSSKEVSTVSHQSPFNTSDISHDMKTNLLVSPMHLYSSADEIEGDFRRMGLGWVGAMLRKTKEAGALSSSSSSEGMPVLVGALPPVDDTDELKDISEIVEEDLVISGSPLVEGLQGRSHSTPVKHMDVPSLSSSSHMTSGDSRQSFINLKTPDLSLQPPKQP